MCGRIVLSKSPREIAAAFGLGEVPDLAPRFNIAPGGIISVIMSGDKDRVLRRLVWGLAPPPGGRPGPGPRLINARSETIDRRETFAESFARRRCLVPVDGFYEWKKSGGKSQPYLVRRRDAGLFALAGIWDRWEYPGRQVTEACAIITTAAAAFMRPIHHRMPVVLAPEHWTRWLRSDPAEAAACKSLLVADESGDLLAHPVDPRMGNPEFDEPRCLETWRPGHTGQLDLFGGTGADQNSPEDLEHE